MVSTHLKNMLVKLDHLPKVRGENSKNIWNHHLDDGFSESCWVTFGTYSNPLSVGTFEFMILFRLTSRCFPIGIHYDGYIYIQGNHKKSTKKNTGGISFNPSLKGNPRYGKNMIDFFLSQIISRSHPIPSIIHRTSVLTYMNR